MSSIFFMPFGEWSLTDNMLAICQASQKGVLEIAAFPDGESYVRVNTPVTGESVVVIADLTQTNSKLFQLLLLLDTLRYLKPQQLTLVVPYLPYMRQDIHFKKYDSFSSKHILKLLNGFDKFVIIDPHLHRIKNLKRFSGRARVITANEVIADYIRKKYKNNFTIVGPDVESAQWGAKIAKMLGKKAVILKKKRYSSRKVRIKEKRIEGNIIVIDDIISTGGTIVETLKIARKQGAEKMVCIGVHGLLLGDAGKLITKYADLVTTNTVPNKYSRIDVSPVIVKALRRYERVYN